MLQQALLVLQLLLVHNVQKTPGIKFVSPLHQVESPLPLPIGSSCFNYSVPPPSPSLWTFICTIHQFGDTALPCTDDSDCITLGWKYGCFLYRWLATI